MEILLVTTCKIIIFFISNFGMWEYFRRISKMNVYFLPAFTISLQVTVLFCAGILNCLKIAALILYSIGIFLSVYYVFNGLKKTIHEYLNVGYLFLAVGFCLVLLACYGHKFTYDDNFSHWAVVSKSLFLTDRFPTFKDSLIIFQEYPLGCTSYIYYFTRFISYSEFFEMAAQSFMMLSFVLPFFVCIKKNKVISFIYVIVLVNYIFCYNIPITDLPVDTVLPLGGMAMLFFVFSESLGLYGENKEKISILYAIPFLCTVIQIKNSGIYFVALACIMIAVSFKNDKKKYKQKLAAVASPFVSLYLWQMHCDYVFVDGSVTKHAMTVENYKNIFSQKTGDNIKTLLESVLKFSISGKELKYILLCLGMAGVLAFFVLDKQNRKKYIYIILGSASIYITYMLGMAGMYLISMPAGEAENLSGAVRYRNTIFIAIYYILSLFLLTMISSIEHTKKKRIYLAGTYMMLLIVWGAGIGSYSFPTIFRNELVSDRRDWVEKAVHDNNIPSGSSYIICVPEIGRAHV